MFFPYKDDNPRILTPIVTYLLIGLNILIFIIQIFGQYDLINHFAIIPNTVFTNFPYFCFTLISSTFLHGGFIHLIGNMIYLWIFGDNVEGYMGHFNFFVFYILCGVIAGCLQTLFDLKSIIPIIGASGAVAGILGSYLILYPKAKIHSILFIFFYFTTLKIPAYIVLIFWFFIQITNGYRSIGMNFSGGIAWFAHIGGFVTGLIFISFFKKIRFLNR